ncbi:uncharacterized protein B0H64DRAFT_21776 [Chaetomium fimeti]|uniref:F-box domain-containing protein n=1 Tax=Chaetomium fimeti TaxID=1854472 RepID=A0AAE0LX72_9PEZI|nr:hypothetical protein B0H64DRAFT_21776 [Chaetomium fimeti]
MFTAEGLETLPTELFIRIIKQLKKADLKSLSLVSKKCYFVVAEPLWESAIIKPLSERQLHQINAGDLPQARFQLARQLHFRSDFRLVLKDRCPHHKDAKGDDGPTPSKIDDEDELHVGSRPEAGEDGDKHPQRFHHLAQQAKLALERLQHDQLLGFSWDLGACVPSDVLGPRGTISLNNPSLRSLTLTTDPGCQTPGAPDSDIDLSALCKLQSLRWRGPGVRHLDTLSLAIENNSGRLQRLELDFIRWGSLERDMMELKKTNLLEAREWCANNIFGLARQSPQPILSAIRELSLAGMPLSDGMARTINLDTLVSLKLRECKNWVGFLEGIIHLGVPIRLKALELRDSRAVTQRDAPVTLNRFLNAFDGLEELFVSYWNSSRRTYVGYWHHASLGIWSGANHHRATLKRLGYHRRWTEWACPEGDVLDLDLRMWGISQIGYEDPSQHQLAELDLDFIGLSCPPDQLEEILLPFSFNASLKVLHIRQSGYGWSLVLEEDEINKGFFRMSSEEQQKLALEQESEESERGVEGGHDTTADEYDAGLRARIRPEFKDFAEWAFGPQGIRSLQAIAYGDFSCSGRVGRPRRMEQLLLCRNAHVGDGENTNFRIVRKDDPGVRVLDEYHDALQALPMEPLLEYSR